MSENELKHLLMKVMDAKRGGFEAVRAMSTGEKVAVAVVLNRPDWLAILGYTLAEAVDRIGPDWLAIVRQAERRAIWDGEEERPPGAQVDTDAWLRAGLETLGTQAQKLTQERRI